MATIIAELYFLDRDVLLKPVYISRNKLRCKDTFVRVEKTSDATRPSLISASQHLGFARLIYSTVEWQKCRLSGFVVVTASRYFPPVRYFSTCASTGTEACKNALHPEDGATYRPPSWRTLSLVSAQQHILVNHLSRLWKAFEGQDKFVWTVVWLVNSPFFTGIDPATFQWPARRFNHAKHFWVLFLNRNTPACASFPDTL